VTPHHGGDFLGVGGHYQAIAHPQLRDAVEDADDQRLTSDRQQGLPGKSTRTEPGGDYAEERHGGRYKTRAVASIADIGPRGADLRVS
jgi:hypothetical protein